MVWSFLVLAAWSGTSIGAGIGGGSSGALALDTDFSDAIAVLGADVSPGQFYAGIHFSEFLLGPSFFGGTGIRTRIAEQPLILSAIAFDHPMSSLTMLVRDNVPTRLTFSLEGTLVKSFQTAGAGYASPTPHGFSGAMFDQIRFTFDQAPTDLDDRFFGIDRLQVTAVPLPGAWPLLCAGLLALWRTRTGRTGTPRNALTA